MYSLHSDLLTEENSAAKRAYELSKEQLLSTHNEQRKYVPRIFNRTPNCNPWYSLPFQG